MSMESSTSGKLWRERSIGGSRTTRRIRPRVDGEEVEKGRKVNGSGEAEEKSKGAKEIKDSDADEESEL